MRILFVTDVSPWPADSGIAMRVQSLLAGLTSRHDVTVVTLSRPRRFADDAERRIHDACEAVITVSRQPKPLDDDRLHAWAPIGSRMRALLESPMPAIVRRAMDVPELVDVLTDLRGRRRFDLAIVQRAPLAELTARCGIGPVAVDLADIGTVWQWRALRAAPGYASKPVHYAELAKLWRYEQSLPRRFHRVLVCKEDDRAFFQSGSNVHVVRNGVTDFPVAAGGTGHHVLFTGTLSYEPNIDAACHFHSAVWPQIQRAQPYATLSIVGRQPADTVKKLDGECGCRVHADVADIEPFFARAAIVVAPIRLGGGTRLKILEALGRGKAVVSTRTAIEGLAVRPGIDLEVVDGPSEFARACVRLLSDPARRRELGESGRRRVRELYGWNAVHDDLDRALADPSTRGPAEYAARAS